MHIVHVEHPLAVENQKGRPCRLLPWNCKLSHMHTQSKRRSYIIQWNYHWSYSSYIHTMELPLVLHCSYIHSGILAGATVFIYTQCNYGILAGPTEFIYTQWNSRWSYRVQIHTVKLLLVVQNFALSDSALGKETSTDADMHVL